MPLLLLLALLVHLDFSRLELLDWPFGELLEVLLGDLGLLLEVVAVLRDPLDFGKVAILAVYLVIDGVVSVVSVHCELLQWPSSRVLSTLVEERAGVTHGANFRSTHTTTPKSLVRRTKCKTEARSSLKNRIWPTENNFN